ITLKNILFATDFSAASNAAAPIAIEIARRYGAKVYGVHVNRFDDYTGAAPNAWAAMAEAAEKETKEDAGRLNEQLQGIEHEVVIGEGSIWEVISNLIEQKEIDLIVLGTRGRTGLGKVILGSVAEEILRQSPCPVLTVGPHVNLWSDQYANMREILFTTDLAADNPIAAPYAISLAQENQAHLVLLHVIEDAKAGDLLDNPKAVDLKERKLQQLVTEQAGLWCEPTYIVEEGPAAEKILDVAKRRHTDLIVMGARPAKGLATHLNIGTVHEVVSQATCPVLTVRG
ncbi:MAG TPA: universal stress protein, partial [Candidatus Acidoferrum sp.]|nr:universal stress protein [Candidatus Acidoferrum sp.]